MSAASQPPVKATGALKPLLLPLTVVTIFLGTLWGGWLHGRMMAPSGSSKALLATAAKRLQQPLGEQLGNWRLLNDRPFSDEVLGMLQCPAYHNRTYVHQQTGDVVSIMVIVGPSGPISVHRPEVCYDAQNFAILGDRTRTTIVDRGSHEHSLWRVSMEARDGLTTPQTVFYGWSNGGSFDSPSEPRISYSSRPYLYKIQLAAPLKSPNDEFKPAEDFLNWFLPEIQTHLVATEPSAAGAPSATK